MFTIDVTLLYVALFNVALFLILLLMLHHFNASLFYVVLFDVALFIVVLAHVALCKYFTILCFPILILCHLM